jgi:hypothetical protein
MHRRLQTNDAFAEIPFGPFLAVRDTDAPKDYGQKSSRRERNESSSFLLSLQGVSAKLILNGVQPDKIHLVPNDENIAFLFPKEI